MTEVSKALLVITSALLLSALLFPVLVDEFPGHTLFWERIFEFGHVPLFGAIALVLLGLARALWRDPRRNPWFDYLVALVGTFLLTMATELVQYFGPRDASLGDLLRDLAGCCCALAFTSTIDSRLYGTALHTQPGRKWILRIASVGLVLPFLFPIPAMINAYHQRERSFPSIDSFESDWESLFMSWVGSIYEITSPPPEWHAATGTRAVRVTFKYNKYPRMVVDEPISDWREYRFLVFDLYSEMEQVVPLILSVSDQEHSEAYSDRFTRRLDVGPGAHIIRVPLEEIRLAPEGRDMRMDAIRWIVFFVIEPAEPVTLWFDNIHLE